MRSARRHHILMTSPSAPSSSEMDEWRLSRASAAKLLDEPEGFRAWDGGFAEPWPIAWNILRRLWAMGLVEVVEHHEHDVTSYEVLPEGRQLLAEIAAGRSTPLTLLAEALLQDETTTVLDRFRPAAAVVPSEGAAAATTRHARMVAHEIRNALVPVQVALAALYRDVERGGGEAHIERHRSAIDGGVDRIFKFVKEMVHVAARASEPAEPFDVVPAIEGAIAAIASDLVLRVSFDKPADLPPLTGDRSRFTLAIINLLRNAAQSRSDGRVGIRVATRISASGDEMSVIIDDDGPGVPAGYREAIFKPGVSVRPGGSGEGLALVREVVEAEMSGRATCEESPSGGARFVLKFPLRKISR